MANCDHGNGSKTKLEIERRDWLKIATVIIGLVVTLSGVFMSIAMYVFQTREQAIVEHAQIRQEAALEKQRAEMQKAFDRQLDDERDKQIQKVGAGLSAIHANQQKMMIEDGYRRREIKPLPAGLDIDPTKTP
jgi:membrane-associated HD superfamily phosphohydrolase